MRRLTERLRDFVGKGQADEAVAPVERAPSEPSPVAAPLPPAAPANPMGANMTVEAAYAMLHAFPKDTDDAQRLPALRSALAATVEGQNKTLQQRLAEVLQEKVRIAGILQTQDRNLDLQLTKITEAVDALWDQRDKLTENNQRITLQGKERIDGLDQLIQCLSATEEISLSPMTLTSLTAPKVEVLSENDEDDGPVIVRMPTMELRPLGDESKSSQPEEEATDETTEDAAEPATGNRRKLYSRTA